MFTEREYTILQYCLSFAIGNAKLPQEIIEEIDNLRNELLNMELRDR